MADACYKPQYLQASFKGVPFQVIEAGSEHGRRGAEGEFPFSEDTAYADLGRKIRRFSVSGKLVENSHIADADSIIAAVESPGPGILIHPTRGIQSVACTSLKVSDRIEEEQGVTYLDFEFVEGNEVGTQLPLGLSFDALALTAVSVALQASFAQKYGRQDIRFYRKNSIRKTVSDGLLIVSQEFEKSIRGTLDNKRWTALSRMNQYILDPSKFTREDETFNVVNQSLLMLSSVSQGEDKYNSFKRVANWAAKNSEMEAEAAEAENSVFMLFRILSSGYMARAAMEVEVNTIQAALDQYDAVSQILNQELILARDQCDSGLYIVLDDFISKVQKSLLYRAYQLPALISYNFNHAVSSLVAAYTIFRDAKRFLEIERRNPQYWPNSVGPIVVAPSR